MNSAPFGQSLVRIQPQEKKNSCRSIIQTLEKTEPVFLNVYGAPESIQGMNFASLCSLAGRYDNPIPPRFLAPIDFLKFQLRMTLESHTVHSAL
jgi:hypothetical protein